MYKKCFKIEYRKDTQEKDMQEAVELLEKHGYICIKGVTQINCPDGLNKSEHHILVARKYKDNKPTTVNKLKGIDNKPKRRK